MERVWGESRADHEAMVGESRVTADTQGDNDEDKAIGVT